MRRAADRRRRRRGRRRASRRPLSLTAWRALIVGQAQLDLARHGRLQALAALVLSRSAEIRDMEIFALMVASALRPEAVVRAQLQHDARFQIWIEAGRVFKPEEFPT